MCKVKTIIESEGDICLVVPFATFLLEAAFLFLFYIHSVLLPKIHISDVEDKSLQTVHQSVEASQL